MEEQKYYFRISPENIKGDLLEISFTAGTDTTYDVDVCCNTTATTENAITGITGVYTGMTSVVSGGPNGESLLTCLTIPILFTQTAYDFGYYTPFDGAALQKDTIINFLYSASTSNPYFVTFLNTSEKEFKKYLSLSTYTIDWGDGVIQSLTSSSPVNHTYPPSTPQQYEITLTSVSPWGISKVTKPINIPYTDATITNPQGTAYFTPVGCTWTGTPTSYDYIFTGDSNTILGDYDSDTFTTTPFLITGFTQSTLNDLAQYGPKYNLFGGKFKLNIPVTGTSGSVGVVYGPSANNTYTAYTVNDILYWDLNDGTTIYFIESYGINTEEYVLSAITKNEALLNVVDQPQIQSDLFIERGKVSGLESLQRLGEIDNLGDISKYGYGYFKVKKY